MVERFFRDITTERLRRGVFTSVPELIGAIDEYISHHNTKPKPFIWTKSARDILQKVIRANSRLSSKQNATLHYIQLSCTTMTIDLFGICYKISRTFFCCIQLRRLFRVSTETIFTKYMLLPRSTMNSDK